MNWLMSLRIKLANGRKRVELYKKLGLNVDGGVDTTIGNRVSFGAEPWLVTIGSHVRITEDVRFITHDGGLWVVRAMYPEYAKADMLKPIVVGDNVHIGINAVIMPGVHIGNNCIIGVGAVVTKDIPDNSIAVGVPARVIETVDEYVQKNKDKFINTKGMTKEQKKEYVMKNQHS